MRDIVFTCAIVLYFVCDKWFTWRRLREVMKESYDVGFRDAFYSFGVSKYGSLTIAEIKQLAHDRIFKPRGLDEIEREALLEKEERGK